MSAGPTKSQRQLESRCVQRGFEYDRMLGLRRAQLFAAHLDVATFATSAECIAAVRAAGRELCAVNLGPPCAGPLRGQITVKSPGFSGRPLRDAQAWRAGRYDQPLAMRRRPMLMCS